MKPVNEAYIKYLEKTIEKIRKGEVFWCALSVKCMDGSYITIHTKDAPKRPRGV